MTVGEMVRVQGERVLAELKRECPEALDGPASSLTGLWLQGLRELGLWDAEVLEGTLAEGNQLDEEGAMWVNVWVASAGRIGRLGDSVRVIVLPVEEK